MTTQHLTQDKGSNISTTNPKREKLIALSQEARTAREENPEFEDFTINQILLFQYSDGLDIEFNTFHQWKEKGFSVKKGETAFLIWGRKRKVEQDKSKNEDAKEYKFFPICFVFSENQVEEI